LPLIGIIYFTVILSIQIVCFRTFPSILCYIFLLEFLSFRIAGCNVPSYMHGYICVLFQFNLSYNTNVDITNSILFKVPSYLHFSSTSKYS
jgi:hypothetical protein